MSSTKIINRAIVLIWISFICQACLIILFSRFKQGNKYENEIAASAFSELFLLIFFINSCVSKNVVQLKFYLIVKVIVLTVTSPKVLIIANKTSLYFVLSLYLFLFFDVSLFFYYYRTLSLTYKTYFYKKLGASDEFKSK